MIRFCCRGYTPQKSLYITCDSCFMLNLSKLALIYASALYACEQYLMGSNFFGSLKGKCALGPFLSILVI
jgi:hypothetical protein